MATCQSIARTPLTTIDDLLEYLQEGANHWITRAANQMVTLFTETGLP